MDDKTPKPHPEDDPEVDANEANAKDVGETTDAAEAEKKAESGFEQAQVQDPRKQDPKKPAPDWVKGQYGKVQEGDAAEQQDPRKVDDDQDQAGPEKREGE